ncbi:MAG: hypothetical protein LBQ40_07705 [Clostridiales bacterium]|jgi:glycerophosphoryl diester phosphodiesterase|nr:hypothetical protein [Clostridiales bacterium]
MTDLTELPAAQDAPAEKERRADWLFSRPIAHRGFHDSKIGIYENSIPAFKRAAKNAFNIETDLYLLKDGAIAAFHDLTLKRLCGQDVKITELTSTELKKFRLGESDDGIPLLDELLDEINGSTGLLLEFKTLSLNGALEQAAYKLLKNYGGNFAVQSFNPYSVSWFKKHAPDIYRGQLAAFIEGSRLEKGLLYALKSLRFKKMNKPDFIAYRFENLPNKYVGAAVAEGKKLLTWTVKSQADADKAVAEFKCDNYIFEDFDPNERL